MDIYVLISLYVWITWVVTDIWWQFHVNSPIRNIFTEKNVDVFNTYFPRCIYSYRYSYHSWCGWAFTLILYLRSTASLGKDHHFSRSATHEKYMNIKLRRHVLVAVGLHIHLSARPLVSLESELSGGWRVCGAVWVVACYTPTYWWPLHHGCHSIPLLSCHNFHSIPIEGTKQTDTNIHTLGPPDFVHFIGFISFKSTIHVRNFRIIKTWCDIFICISISMIASWSQN